MMNRRTEPTGATFDLRRSRRVPAQLPVVAQGKSDRRTSIRRSHAVLSYLVLMVVSLLCRSPSERAKGLSCGMSPTARNRTAESCT